MEFFLDHASKSSSLDQTIFLLTSSSAGGVAMSPAVRAFCDFEKKRFIGVGRTLAGD
jgi:hypothetical protein